jgi:hypothetical protein
VHRLSRRILLAAAAALAAAVALIDSDGSSRLSPASRPVFAPGTITDAFLSRRQVARVVAASWHGGPVQAKSGEPLAIYVSDSYPDDPAATQHWADYFASLLHGSELSLLSAYVAAPAEIAGLCGDDALGCYGSDRLVIPAETLDGITPEDVAAHEYGHHIAENRQNPPWRAVDSGPKRWASYENVCARTKTGAAFPGDEGEHYRLNPGEAWAETYRLLNDSKDGIAPGPWAVVDSSFYPDAPAFQAVEDDVLHPYAASAPSTVTGHFALHGKRIWTYLLPTPLDGQLSIVLTLPQGTLYDLRVLAAAGTTPLATGLWSGVGQKTLGYSICGERSLVVRVTRRGDPGRFSLQISQP